MAVYMRDVITLCMHYDNVSSQDPASQTKWLYADRHTLIFQSYIGGRKGQSNKNKARDVLTAQVASNRYCYSAESCAAASHSFVPYLNTFWLKH